MRYSVQKIYQYAARFLKQAQSAPTSLHEYEAKGLLDPTPWRGKRAREGFSITGKPYPSNYIGGFNPDGSGLPTGFDDDVSIDSGMDKNQIQFWVGTYLGETEPGKLMTTASQYAKMFPLAAKLLQDKAKFIQVNVK